jgi:GNAT superfamily N-acetyltransferase
MAEILTLDRVADLSDADQAAIRALTAAVYPPAASADWPGRHLEWAAHDWCARIRDETGQLVSYVGVVVRTAVCGSRPVVVGGIGGVKTHPSARRRGLAARAIGRSVEFFHEHGIDFGLLVCQPGLIPYYATLGWGEFRGRLLVRQHGATVAFTLNHVMTLGVNAAAPESGSIDLLGPPW